MRSFWTRFVGLTALSVGLLLAVVTAFLAYWQRASDGEPDIAARGGMLLFILLPWILAIAAAMLAALAAALLRPLRVAWSHILPMSLGGLVVAACLEFLPPLFLLPRMLSVLPTTLRPSADFLFAGLLIVGGATLARRSHGR